MTTSVLIVDDDPVIQLLLRVNFEMDGFEVTTADDGEEGLAKARSVLPDLVLLDVMMPKMDGYTVLRELRQDSKTAETTVVLLSANVDPADRAAGIEAGAQGYVTKPFDPLKLLDQVKELLEAEKS